MKYWELEIDGVDRSGKDTLLYYITQLTNYKYSINCRGVLSQLVYNNKYDRHYSYDLSTISKRKIIILLSANLKDLEIRAKRTNEPEIDFESDMELFNFYADYLELEGYTIYRYNTSENSIYDIANDIISKINFMEMNEK